MSQDQPPVPDVDQLTRSMLLLRGDHGDHHHAPPGGSDGPAPRSWSKSRSFADDPVRAAAVAEATRADRERYLTTGLHPVDCRFCHCTVSVRFLGPGHTAVQWNSKASQRCAYFTDIRESGGDPARARACPKISDSIEHAVSEGVLERRDASQD